MTVYEAQPRFTLDTADTAARRSLAVRFRKVLAQTLPRPKLPRRMIAFDVRTGQSGVALTGFSPLWIVGEDLQSVRAVTESAPVYALAPFRGGDVDGYIVSTSSVSAGWKAVVLSFGA